jgi:hypothetical protein
VLHVEFSGVVTQILDCELLFLSWRASQTLQ